MGGVTACWANLRSGASTKRMVLIRESRCRFLFSRDRHCSLTKRHFTRNHHLQMMLVAKQHFWECEDGELGSALKSVPKRTSAAEEIHVIKIMWLWQSFMRSSNSTHAFAACMANQIDTSCFSFHQRRLQNVFHHFSSPPILLISPSRFIHPLSIIDL